MQLQRSASSHYFVLLCCRKPSTSLLVTSMVPAGSVCEDPISSSLVHLKKRSKTKSSLCHPDKRMDRRVWVCQAAWVQSGWLTRKHRAVEMNRQDLGLSSKDLKGFKEWPSRFRQVTFLSCARHPHPTWTEQASQFSSSFQSHDEHLPWFAGTNELDQVGFLRTLCNLCEPRLFPLDLQPSSLPDCTAHVKSLDCLAPSCELFVNSGSLDSSNSSASVEAVLLGVGECCCAPLHHL